MIDIINHLQRENQALRKQLAEVGKFYNINEKWVRIDEKVPNCRPNCFACACEQFNDSPYCRE